MGIWETNVREIKTKDMKYIVVQEKVINSILIDIGTFGSIVGAFWFNHVFVGSKFLSALLFICWLLWISVNSAKRTVKYDSTTSFVTDIAEQLNIKLVQKHEQT